MESEPQEQEIAFPWKKSIMVGARFPLAVVAGVVMVGAGSTVIGVYRRSGQLSGEEVVVTVVSWFLMTALWPEKESRKSLRQVVSTSRPPPYWLIPLISGVGIMVLATASILGFLAVSQAEQSKRDRDLIVALHGQTQSQAEAMRLVTEAFCIQTGTDDPHQCADALALDAYRAAGTPAAVIPQLIREATP